MVPLRTDRARRVVDPVHVVGMIVGEQHRVNRSDTPLYELEAKLWGCVDEHPSPSVEIFDHGRRSSPPVPGVGRGAYVT